MLDTPNDICLLDQKVLRLPLKPESLLLSGQICSRTNHSRRVFKLCIESLNHQHSVCKSNGETSQKKLTPLLLLSHFSRSKDLQIHKIVNSQLSLLSHPLSSTGKSLGVEVSSNHDWGSYQYL